MNRFSWILGLFLFFALLCSLPVTAGEYFEKLKQDQTINGFRTAALYENAKGEAFGARFISEKNGFTIDLLQIQSVPQAFYWIKTPIYSSHGEPHACEHLLLGKGNRGRYVAAMEDMSLSSSSAFTGQYRTCYHFNTIAGDDTFYKIFEAKLMAFLHPDFTDEEIRREVCHIGVTINPEDSSLMLDEKGTVYTEMVSSFEKPWYHTWRELSGMTYGYNHPLTYVSGGDPDVMRNMVPADLWKFHKRTHHLANMGVVVAIPSSIKVNDFLKHMEEILGRCQPGTDETDTPGIGGFNFPPKDPAPLGTLKMVSFPSGNPEDPGNMLYAWPADLKLDYREETLFDLFVDAFASGQTSDLYNLFINSETRKIDLGANSIYAGLDTDQGVSMYIGINGVNNDYITETMTDSVRSMILNAIKKIRDYPADSEELAKFNDQIRSRLQGAKKRIEDNLNSPPMFGYRRISGQWVDMLEDLEDVQGFRKSLMFRNRFDYIDSLLDLKTNIWTDRINDWHLISTPPYAVGASPDPGILEKKQEEKNQRLAGYIAEFEKNYGVDDAQLAISKYKEEFDAKTAELEEMASRDEIPGFIDNPPLTLDDQLNYETIKLENDVPMVASTFENMTSSNVGLALRLDVIPESRLVYVPLLPDILTDIGVYKDGEKITFDNMQNRLRNEVLSLRAGFDRNDLTDRVELVLTGEGSNTEELKNALDWMDAALYAPYLSVENAPRIKDVVEQSIQGARNRIKGPEEYWLTIPARGYRFQQNPLILSTGCFLTQVHQYQRLKWMLTDPGTTEDQSALRGFLKGLAEAGRKADRERVNELLGMLEAGDAKGDTTAVELIAMKQILSETAEKTADEILQSLRETLADIPDQDLQHDWAYLCREINNDLMVKPEMVIAEINQVLDLVRRADNARMYMISNSSDRKAVMGKINSLVAKLDKVNKSKYQNYEPKNRIAERIKGRYPGADNPMFVGLVHKGTNNGALIFSAKISEPFYDTSTASILNCLSGKLMGGSGPHGLFMRTWAAGLAYSNGFTYDQGNGRVGYYAERCPDVAETMRFVANELKNAKHDPALVDYATAQVFGFSRAPSRYDGRGREMAADLVDGYTPERVSRFRQKVLDIRDQENLYDTIEKRMGEAYGPVVIGYGSPVAQSEDAVFFVVGPEAQFKSLERYIAENEEPQTIYRLYPRDYWLTPQ